MGPGAARAPFAAMNTSTIRPDRLARLRRICLDLPEATEKVAWGDPTWRIRDRIFAMQKGNYSGGRPSLWLKAPEGAQAALVEGDPDTFFVPPYVGHKGWVGLYLDGRRLDFALLDHLIEQSYRLIAPKSLAKNLDSMATRKANPPAPTARARKRRPRA